MRSFPKHCVIAIAVALSVVSCQKQLSFQDPISGSDSTSTGSGSGTTNSSSIQGAYSFTSTHVKYTTTLAYSELGNSIKSVSAAEYTSTNNKGTVTINATTVTTTDIAYSFSTSIHSASYLNGSLQYQTDVPYSFDVPATNGSSSYTKIGSDSLYFPSGGFETIADQPVSTTAAGYKYTLVNNVLTLINNFTQSQNTTTDGVSATTTTVAHTSTTLTRQ